MNSRSIVLCLLAVSVSGCQTVGQHAEAVRKAETDTNRVTVASVQREIKVGISGADVMQALGSPNVITTDSQRQEVWVYDKISTSEIQSQSSNGINFLIVGNVSQSGARSTSQRTLTVIIKFDQDKKVRDFSYHTSRF